MLRSIDRFIFVPGLGAGADHPAAKLITQGIREATGGAVTTEIATTCDEFDGLHIPHPIEKQVGNLAERISRKRGRVAIFAHSMGGVTTAMTLASREFSQVDPADVILAGTPIHSTYSLTRVLGRLSRLKADTDTHEALERQLKGRIGAIHSVITMRSNSKKPTRYNIITHDYVASHPTPPDHLRHLRKLGASTLLLSEKERVTDCTADNVTTLLPDRLISTNPSDTDANTIIMEGADHNLKGFCETAVPQIILQRILGLGANS